MYQLPSYSATHRYAQHTGTSVVVQRVDSLGNMTQQQQQACPPELKVSCACSASLNLTMIGKNMFAVQPLVQYVVANLGDAQCALAACPHGWGMLRLTRRQEDAGEFIPDLVGSSFHMADGLMATSFVASAQGDEVEPFSQLLVKTMLGDNPSISHTVCVADVERTGVVVGGADGMIKCPSIRR